MGHYKFKGGPQLYESKPIGRLLFESFEEFINSLVLVPNFQNQKSYLAQIFWHLRANKSLQLPPQ